MLQGEEFFTDSFNFTKTEPYTSSFEYFGYETKNFLINSGSFNFYLITIIVYTLLKMLVNQVCVYFARYRTFRNIGVWAYNRYPRQTTQTAIIKLLLEAFFELCICQILAFIGYFESDDLMVFFNSFDNVFCTIMTVFTSIVIWLFIPMSYYTIKNNFKNL